MGPQAALDVPSPADVPSPVDPPTPVDLPTPIDLPTPSLAEEAHEAEKDGDDQAREEAPAVAAAAAVAVPAGAAAPELDAPDAASFFVGDQGGETDPLIEDPGFAEVGRVHAPDPVGFEDKPFFAGGVDPTQGSSAKSWVLWAGGAGALVAAGLAAVVVLGSSEEPQIAQRPKPPPIAVAAAPLPALAAESDPIAGGEPGDEVPWQGEALEDQEPVAPVEAAELQDPVEVIEEPPEVVEEVLPELDETLGERERRLERERLRQERRDELETQPPADEQQVDPASAWAGPQEIEEEDDVAVADNASPWGSAEVSRGRLTITSNPAGAVVRVDGRRIGLTPTSTEVDYGSHTLRVELADHRAASKTISVRSAQMSLPFRLTPAEMYARCNLSGPIGAKVLMDGRPLGSLPRTVRCSAGAHRFMVVPAGGDSYSKVRKIAPTESGESINVYLGGG